MAFCDLFLKYRIFSLLILRKYDFFLVCSINMHLFCWKSTNLAIFHKLHPKYVNFLAFVFFPLFFKGCYFAKNWQNSLFVAIFWQLNFWNMQFLSLSLSLSLCVCVCVCVYVIDYINASLFPKIGKTQIFSRLEMSK